MSSSGRTERIGGEQAGMIAGLRSHLRAIAADDPRRAPVLLRLATALLESDRLDPASGVEAGGLLEEGLDLLRTGDVKGGELLPYYRLLAEADELSGDTVGALDALRRGIGSISDSEMPAAEGELELEAARLRSGRSEYAEALGHLERALALFEQVDDERGRAIALKGMADLHAAVGDNDRALSVAFDALRSAERGNADEIIGVCLADIALIESDLGDHDRALDHLERARDTFAAIDAERLEVRTLANLSSVAAAAGRNADGLSWGLRALAAYEAIGDRRSLATTLANLAPIYEALDDDEAALECNRRSFDLFEEIGEDEGCATVLLNSARIFHGRSEFQDAIYVATEAAAIAEDLDEDRLRMVAHELLSESYERIGDLERGIEHLRRTLALRDTIVDSERRRGLADLQAQYDLERAVRERELYRRENERLEEENRSKEAELGSLSMLLVERSRFIKGIRLAVEKLSGRVPEKVADEVDEILRTIRTSSSREADWQEFERQFRKVHHDFIDRLARRFPDLTKSELKVCALVRTGLSSAEIASMLHVTKRNIDTHRYRLRKKLGIATETSLSSFFNSV